MALFDFLKRKKEVQNAKEKQPGKRAEEVLVTKKEDKKADRSKPVASKVTKGFSYQSVKEPHISEKSSNLAEKNKYVFKIYNNINKTEVKKSVEGIYGVDVTAVNIVKVPSKKRRLGRIEGLKKSYVKAIVTVKEGQKIEIL
jgi:large subunit ribosomal protein L23